MPWVTRQPRSAIMNSILVRSVNWPRQQDRTMTRAAHFDNGLARRNFRYSTQTLSTPPQAILSIGPMSRHRY